MDLSNVAQIVVDPRFLMIYVTGLIVLAVLRLWSAEARLQRERATAFEITRHLVTIEAAIQVKRLEKYQGGRSAGIKGSRPGGVVWRSVLTFLSAIEEVPRSRHVSEGLRPSENFFQAELVSCLPRVSDFGDTIIRLSLIGTFAGLIAALTIASNNIGPNLAQGSDPTSQMQSFLQKLLSSAAVKFWISTVGLILALLLRVWQGRLDRIINRMARQLGHAFDLALDDTAVLRAWNCRKTETQ